MYGSCDRKITNEKWEFVLIKAGITEKYMQCVSLTGSFEGRNGGCILHGVAGFAC